MSSDLVVPRWILVLIQYPLTLCRYTVYHDPPIPGFCTSWISIPSIGPSRTSEPGITPPPATGHAQSVEENDDVDVKPHSLLLAYRSYLGIWCLQWERIHTFQWPRPLLEPPANQALGDRRHGYIVWRAQRCSWADQIRGRVRYISTCCWLYGKCTTYPVMCKSFRTRSKSTKLFRCLIVLFSHGYIVNNIQKAYGGAIFLCVQ